MQQIEEHVSCYAGFVFQLNRLFRENVQNIFFSYIFTLQTEMSTKQNKLNNVIH